jgi:uncharacterized membrane protein YgaE (UPF0421/DUF939 family)
MQTRKQSLFEAIMNVVVGLGVSMALNFAVFPLFGWHISLSQNLILGMIYTVVSIVRSYCLRRFFNKMHRAIGQ